MIGMAKEPAKKTGKISAKKPRGPVLFIQLNDSEEAALQSFITSQVVEPDRSAVGKKALLRFLESQGHWPPKPVA